MCFCRNLRYILQQIKSEVEKKWPVRPHAVATPQVSNGAVGGACVNGGGPQVANGNKLFRYRVIASFIFLRCISLALCTPRKYHLQIGSPAHIEQVQDMLKLLAKLLQSWANFTQLKENPSYEVQCLNSYLRHNQERMEHFLEGVSTSPQGSTRSSVYNEDLKDQSELAEKFASVLTLCCDNHAKLRKQSFSTVSCQI